MILYAIVILTLVTLLLDLYIYRRLRVDFPQRRRWRRVYLIGVASIDLLTVSALLLYQTCSSMADQSYMIGVMWIIFSFFFCNLPKLGYVIFSLLGRGVALLLRRRSGWGDRLGVVAAAVILLTMGWGATYGRSAIEVKEVVIESNKLPAAFDGYRVVQFSDLHLGNLPRNRHFVSRMVNEINALHPNVVINSGDLINIMDEELNPATQQILGGIRATDGVYSVWGNHDLGFYIPASAGVTATESVDAMRRKKRAMGWELLENRSVYLHRDTDSIALSGVTYPVDNHHNGRDSGLAGSDFAATYSNVTDSTFNILISHTPANWNEVLEHGVSDLTLSGHVHAMQLKIGLFGESYSPAQWMYDRWTGLHTENGRHLYINDGMGYVLYPMRIGTRPEITLITLRRSR